MDDKRFDALARSLAAGASRRLVLKGLLGGLVGGVALGSAGKTFAQDEEPPVVESQDPVVEEVPPPDETVTDGDPPPAEEPPAEEPPAEEPPVEEPPAEEPPAEPAVDEVDEGTPADPAAPPPAACEGDQIACGAECCGLGWRCCGVYCIPERDGSCCSDTECSVCEICSLDGLCYPVCEDVGLDCCVDEERGIFTCAECCRDDPSCEAVIDCEFCHSIGQECCIDDKHHVTCAYCCDNSDCAEWGSCHTCYGGYCLSCFDQTDGNAPICAIDSCGATVAAGGDSGGYCVQCCEDYQCGPCQRCHDGWCEYVCDSDEQCCTLNGDVAAAALNGGYCAHCCGSEDCGACESCYDGHCEYQCDKGETCCHGEYCAYENEGCCGVPGDWCDAVAPSDNLSGYCCDGLSCCYDEKTKSSSCAECCGDYDCGDGYCCNGVCQAQCCKDKDCEYGYCIDGYCSECRGNDDCGHDEICCNGTCYGGYQCCYENEADPVNCGECETCIEGWCRPTGVELYGVCNPMYVFAADADSPQLNCCNGLVCCDSHKYGLVCLECCADADCADGCFCDDGFCSCPCWSDKDCADGTCCCKNGSCSADCCPTPEPPKPPKPHKPDSGGTITTLPATGSGDSKDGSSWIGAAALGAAAAYLASRKLKPEQAPGAEAAEE
jgi:LPXTG-motif cell wall-anchored protein